MEDSSKCDAAELLPLVYDELRKLARHRMAGEPVGQTLQPTALVHEAYLRLYESRPAGWANRAEFFAAAAEAMRRILVDRARRRRTVKHGGDRTRVNLEIVELVEEPAPEELLSLDDALTRLEAEDGRAADVVKLRYFAGMTVHEVAEALNIAPRTVHREWDAARAWLCVEAQRGDTRAS